MMNNLNNVELVISSLEENQDFIMLKNDYKISPKDLEKITKAITGEAIELDNMGIIIQYEIWEIIIIDSIDRYMTREYDTKTGKQLPKPELYAEDCVRRSIAESSPVDIPNIEYAHISNPTFAFVKKKQSKNMR